MDPLVLPYCTAALCALSMTFILASLAGPWLGTQQGGRGPASYWVLGKSGRRSTRTLLKREEAALAMLIIALLAGGAAISISAAIPYYALSIPFYAPLPPLILHMLCIFIAVSLYGALVHKIGTEIGWGLIVAIMGFFVSAGALTTGLYAALNLSPPNPN